MTAGVAIVGAGLCGNLAAILLARRGLPVTVYERAPAPDPANDTGGRSINLALAARGIRALEHARTFERIEPLLLPMKGRIVHELTGATRFLSYGQHADECIWSVSRQALNRALIEVAQSYPNVTYRFGHRCVGIDSDSLRVSFESDDGELDIEPVLLLGADGAGSIIRRQLTASGCMAAEEALLDHGYKELTIPPRPDGKFALDPEGLHIWPRGGFMLIALPNLDRSFTVTLFLPAHGRPGFGSIATDAVRSFFAHHFPDAAELIPDLERDFATKPVGTLGTVHCRPWHLSRAGGASTVLLLGDAAHAIVPFHGQGMNAAFEDCVELDRLIERLGADWASVALSFDTVRREHALAIAEMALENYDEMRDTVRDPEFERRAELAFELEKRYPGRFVPRYSMVMFHPEIGYAEAQQRGRIQAELLTRALAETDPAAALRKASTLVERML